MKADIQAVANEVLAVVADIGGMSTNVGEAGEWMDTEQHEEAKLSLAAVSTGAADAMTRLRAIALKCEELCATTAAKKARAK